MDQPVADQGPSRVPLCVEPGKVERLGFRDPHLLPFREVLLGGLAGVLVAAAWVGVGWRGKETQVLTKQMPARRRRTSVHRLLRRQRAVTTVTFSSCRTLGCGWFVPSWPQPMARHLTPLPTPWFCSGSWATCTLALMVADPLSCSGQDRPQESHPGW